MKKILTMILITLMLVVTFAGCGSEETPEPEAPAEIEVPEEAPEENEAVHWSADEWVINGVSVFSGSESIDAIAAIIGAEARFSGLIVGGIEYPTTFIDADTLLPDMGEMAMFSHNHNLFTDIQTAQPGVTLMRGITTGETTVDEVLAMFPMNDEFSYGIVESGDGAYRWGGWHVGEDGVSISFEKWGADPAIDYLRYTIVFINDVARAVMFHQHVIIDNEEASPLPTNEPTSSTDEPASALDDVSFLLGRWNCDDQFYPEFFFLPGDYAIYHEAYCR